MSITLAQTTIWPNNFTILLCVASDNRAPSLDAADSPLELDEARAGSGAAVVGVDGDTVDVDDGGKTIAVSLDCDSCAVSKSSGSAIKACGFGKVGAGVVLALSERFGFGRGANVGLLWVPGELDGVEYANCGLLIPIPVEVL